MARDVFGTELVNATHEAFVVIQEGGSSEEIYIHASDSEADAEAFRVSCRDDGAYRTSDVIEVPAALAAHGDSLYSLLEAVAQAEFDYPENDAASAGATA